MSDSLRPISQIASDLEDVRASIMAATRRLRVAANTGELSVDALYREVAGMRACSQAFTAIVDDMCQHCFPMPLNPFPKHILRFICDHSPIPEDQARTRARATDPQRTDSDEIIDRIIAAGYVNRSNDAGRNMLSVSETGRAANAGIIWAQP